MKKFNYCGIEVVENQEPTQSQIRRLMKILNADYYTAQEELKQISYGTPPEGYSTWTEYNNTK